MPTNVYSLVFKDPELEKLASSNMEIGNYTSDTVKIVGSSKFYLVHLDTKKLQELTFFVASNDVMEVYCCHVQLPLCLDIYKQEQDWITYHQEQV